MRMRREECSFKIEGILCAVDGVLKTQLEGKMTRDIKGRHDMCGKN